MASRPRHPRAGESGGAFAPFQAPKGNVKQHVHDSDGLSVAFISEFNVSVNPDLVNEGRAARE